MQTFIYEFGDVFLQSISVLFLAILFLQSGIDKVVDRRGNLSWLKEHFSNSPFKHNVPLLLFVITLVELFAGLCSLIGGALIIYNGNTSIAIVGVFFAMLSLIMLFTGQRLAKDYAGAQSLVSYFILSIVTLLVLMDKF